jgi:hypothetical protein
MQKRRTHFKARNASQLRKDEMKTRPKSENPVQETHFNWCVGHSPPLVWRGNGSSEDLYLVRGSGTESVTSGFYHPLKEVPDLFVKFSRIDSPEAVLEFANRYGVLGLSLPERESL